MDGGRAGDAAGGVGGRVVGADARGQLGDAGEHAAAALGEARLDGREAQARAGEVATAAAAAAAAVFGGALGGQAVGWSLRRRYALASGCEGASAAGERWWY